MPNLAICTGMPGASDSGSAYDAASSKPCVLRRRDGEILHAWQHAHVIWYFDVFGM
jgi:hypothetical protein